MDIWIKILTCEFKIKLWPDSLMTLLPLHTVLGILFSFAFPYVLYYISLFAKCHLVIFF